MKKSYALPIIILIAVVCSATTCRKEIIYTYSFSEKIKISPEKKSYRIGDTIWLQHNNAGNRLLDSKTNQFILADTFNIGFRIDYQPIYNYPTVATNKFCEFVISSQADIGNNYFRIFFGCNANSSFNFKIGIIPKEKGYYNINLSNINDAISCNFQPQTVASLDLKFDFNDGNKDIYLQEVPYSRRRQDDGVTGNQIDYKMSYFVKVE